MKYTGVIEIVPKHTDAITDGIDGEATLQALRESGFAVDKVRVGTVIEVELECEEAEIGDILGSMCRDVLADPDNETFGFRAQFTGPFGWGETPMRYLVEDDEVKSVDLAGKFPAFGPYEILRAEWKVKDPIFVLLRYAKNGVEEELGLRMDLDKRAILQDLDDPEIENIRARAMDIWTEVIIGMNESKRPQTS